jgi:hypothetical protein
VKPRNRSDAGDAITVKGGLVVRNAGVLDALVDAGPRARRPTNAGSAPVTVDTIAARAD